MNFNDPFEKYWFNFGQFQDVVTNNPSLREQLKSVARHSYNNFEVGYRSLRDKIKEYELKYDNE